MASVVNQIANGIKDVSALAAIISALVCSVESLFVGQKKKGKKKSKLVKQMVAEAGISVETPVLQQMIDERVAAGFDQPASMPVEALPKNGLDPETGRPIGLTSAHSGVK